MATPAEREYGSRELALQEMGTGQLVRDLIEQSQELVREEVRLAKAELRDEVRSASRSGALLAAGGVVGLGAFLVLSFCVVFLLGLAMPLWVGALIVGAVLALVCGGLIWTGRDRLQSLSLKPQETLETLEEDRRWARETMHAAKSRRHASA